MTDTTLELVSPDVTLHREWLDFLARWGAGHVPGSGIPADELALMADPDVFARMVGALADQERAIGLADDRVPASTRWIRRDGEVVGTISLRHELNDYLLHVEGGHIGYGVAPQARRQGVASGALRMVLAEAATLGINPVLLTCDEDNLGSRRTIEGAGGVYEGSREGSRRYWITIPDTPLGYAVRPLSERPLLGRLVTLRLPSHAEIAAIRAAGPEGRADPSALRPDWAPGFPRQDDVDGCSVAGPGPAEGDPARAWGPRLVVRRSDGLVVGTLGFYGPPDPSDPDRTVEIGYGLVESARGQGLVTDALRLAVPAAEASGATLQAHAAYDNIASRAALRRAGFRETGERNALGELRLVRPRT